MSPFFSSLLGTKLQMCKMGTFGSIVSRLLSIRTSPSLEMEARLTQHTPLSVWSSSKSILDKLVQVQHTEGPWLLIVHNCAKSHSVWKGRKDTYDKLFYIYYLPRDLIFCFFDFWCFNATFSNISAISWRPVLVVEEAGVPGETTELGQATGKLDHLRPN